MPLTLQVGVSRKLGLPNYGSVGASCAAQVELEPLVLNELATLDSKIQAAFDVCRRAVENELARCEGGCGLPAQIPAQSSSAEMAKPPPPAGGALAPLATQRQLDFLYQLAHQIRALGGQRLPLLAEQQFGKPLAELSTLEASRLIELLKEVRDGARDVEAVLSDLAA